MRRYITLSVCLTLIASCLAAPEPLGCTPGDLSVACSSLGIFTTNIRPTSNVERNIAQPTNEDGCQCVPYYQCYNNTINTNGGLIIDPRFGDPSNSISTQAGENRCVHYLDVCCMPPDVLESGHKITMELPVRRGCGQMNVDGVGSRITGGENEAQFGEIPWMVAILGKAMIDPNTGEPTVYMHCGGSLIHPRAVITAAHCVQGKKPSELTVRAGEWDTQTRTEILPHQHRDVEHVITHENFNPVSLQNDIAILILKTPVDLAENVDLVCLPAHNETFDAARCVTSGWGKDKFGKEGYYQVILKKLELPVVPRDVCQSSLRKTRLGRYFILNSSFICAGGEAGKDACTGDGGGPLVCPKKNDPSRYVQAGIVAWGIGCGENGTPGVYANVALFRPWIDEQLVLHNLDITVYQQ